MQLIRLSSQFLHGNSPKEKGETNSLKGEKLNKILSRRKAESNSFKKKVKKSSEEKVEKTILEGKDDENKFSQERAAKKVQKRKSASLLPEPPAFSLGDKVLEHQ